MGTGDLGDGGVQRWSQIYTDNLQLPNAFLRKFVAESVLHLPLPPLQKNSSYLCKSHDPHGRSTCPPVATLLKFSEVILFKFSLYNILNHYFCYCKYCSATVTQILTMMSFLHCLFYASTVHVACPSFCAVVLLVCKKFCFCIVGIRCLTWNNYLKLGRLNNNEER